MNPCTRTALLEVFGDPTNVAPVGTGAVLTRASTLDKELAEKSVEGLDLSRVFRDLGAVAARELADELERRGLKPADFSSLDGLPKRVSKRLLDNLAASEVFTKSFREHLAMRG